MKALLIGFVLVAGSWAQSSVDQDSTGEKTAPDPGWTRVDSGPERKHQRGAAGDVGSGAGDIGTGVAKGAGDAAKGTAKTAVDIATLHPIDAVASAGKGAVTTGKDVTVGTVKGTAKITRGIGKAIKKIF